MTKEGRKGNEGEWMDGWMAKVAHLTRRKHFFFFFPNQQLTPSLEPILEGTDHVT